FAVLLGDDVVSSRIPCLRQLMDVFEDYSNTVLGVQKVSPDDVNKYGIISCEELGERLYKVKDLVEKPAINDAPSNVAILGRYIITPEIFDILGKTEPGSGGEIQLTDALRTLGNSQPMYAYNFEGKRYDIGSKLGFLQATVEFALQREDLKDEFIEYLKEVYYGLF
ncbi:MAG TPA: sugar phosphate nucleotidyltransferase, partial [Bacillota bacterium]|nr:sugar phosphate nucleotidyltransferase [Bacillota bacterium]